MIFEQPTKSACNRPAQRAEAVHYTAVSFVNKKTDLEAL